jgi:hypothetical protein
MQDNVSVHIKKKLLLPASVLSGAEVSMASSLPRSVQRHTNGELLLLRIKEKTFIAEGFSQTLGKIMMAKLWRTGFHRIGLLRFSTG